MQIFDAIETVCEDAFEGDEVLLERLVGDAKELGFGFFKEFLSGG